MIDYTQLFESKPKKMMRIWERAEIGGGAFRCLYPGCNDPYLLEFEFHWHEVEDDS